MVGRTAGGASAMRRGGRCAEPLRPSSARRGTLVRVGFWRSGKASMEWRSHVSWRSFGAYALMIVVFGLSWVAVKAGLSYWPPILYSALVLTGAAVVNGIYLAVARVPIRWAWSEIVPPALYAVMQAAVMVATYWGQVFVPAGRAALLNATVPGFTLLASMLVWRQAATWRQGLAMVIGILGVALAVSRIEGGGFTGSPVARYGAQGLLLGGAALTGLVSVWAQKHLVHQAHLGVTTFWRLWAGAAVLALIALMWEPVHVPLRITWAAFGYLGYLAVFDWFLGTLLWFYLLRAISVVLLNVASLMTAVLAVASSAWLLGEAVTWPMAVGGALVLGSMALIMGDGSAAAPRPPVARDASETDGSINPSGWRNP